MRSVDAKFGPLDFYCGSVFISEALRIVLNDNSNVPIYFTFLALPQ